MKKFQSVKDIDNVHAWVDKALEIKRNPLLNNELGKNKTLGLLFYNPSLRTRLSSQKAAYNLGMNVIVMNLSQEAWQLELEDGTVMDLSTQEHIKEAAAVISQYCDIVGLRTFPSLTNKDDDYNDKVFQKFLDYLSVPLISLESAILHPLQSFADAITIKEQQKTAKPKVVLSWAPHPRALPQAVANSFSEWMLAAQYDLVITHPEGMDMNPKYTQGASIETNQKKAFEGADFVYAKNWSSYQDYGKVLHGHEDWMISPELLALTNQAKFMHCLPIRRNVVASDAVLDGPHSIVIEQANNRTYAMQTVLKEILL